MRNINHRSKVKNAIFILYVIISIAVLIGVFSWANKEQTRLYNLVSKDQEKLKTAIQENKLLAAIQLGDHHFINGNTEKAKEQYISILNNLNLNSIQKGLVEQKLEAINSIKDSSSLMSNELSAYQFKLKENNKVIDSLDLVVEQIKSNSLRETKSYKKIVSDLKKDLKKKESELTEERSVQTISFKNDNGDVIHYLGKIDDEMANGGGIGIWNTGSLYKGDWKDNQRHGKGEFTWSDGHKYKGEFEKDVRQGNGIYYWPSGEKYEGQWSDGKRNGQGTLYDKDGNIQYQGEWKNDKIVNKNN